MAESRPPPEAETMASQPSRMFRGIEAKRPWPPDFSKMSDSDKYRLERKYKRRLRRGYPAGWMKFTGVLQILTVTALPAYMILFMDWKEVQHPFGPLRAWMWEKIDAFKASQNFTRESAIVRKPTSPPENTNSR
ncbi:hypothetical protein DRE_03273 [Drechslerella stenobrocha 248]|uniref:Uncharacterized protein n=1 Tax=Drechslerella stenobrocha 248 TaxID=1043628 RepID=W7I669_9PEZI|nr:hypothetical protein DRE_03273 [Drechslerella stenobrocha 248]